MQFCIFPQKWSVIVYKVTDTTLWFILFHYTNILGYQMHTSISGESRELVWA